MSCEISIDKFEGPLDLLLHLIRKEEMDIYEIEIAQITRQYLDFIDAMQSLNLDIAGEYLVMAATLLQIKSRMLLPVHEEEMLDEEEADPRAELIRRLLEYQRYKDAALTFAALPQLDRDVFLTSPLAEENGEEASLELEPVGLYALVEAFRDLLKKAPIDFVHEVTAEHLSVTERIQTILNLLQQRPQLPFSELVPMPLVRSEVVVMFLAMLELVKMNLIKIYQNQRYTEIWLSPAVVETDDLSVVSEDSFGYA
ncbi:MAG: segregation/condensation protein A [Deltaproteobacteria bacterium HGW-Deltaproteobacteria-4]|nr:MAG: segregation/condensation protein A [Deltaproteobacteria bacterium HGW-Deltaproteobacteria-4]